jgi:hypothetical protein
MLSARSNAPFWSASGMVARCGHSCQKVAELQFIKSCHSLSAI